MVRSVSRREAVLEDWLLLFYLFSVAGWVWEVLLTALATGQWVNRGMLRGPWLPVYGAGGMLMAALLRSRRNRGTVPFLAALAGGGVEYATALALELRFRQRWWDYTGLPGSLQGRVCLASLLGFALAGWVLAWLTPRLDRRLKRLNGGIRTAVCRSVSLIFALDWSLSLLWPNAGTGITCPLYFAALCARQG